MSSGLYRLIFRSKKPAAKRFRKWVTQEVPPAIRRTGRYERRPEDQSPSFEALRSDPSENAVETARLLCLKVREVDVRCSATSATCLRSATSSPTPIGLADDFTAATPTRAQDQWISRDTLRQEDLDLTSARARSKPQSSSPSKFRNSRSAGSDISAICLTSTQRWSNPRRSQTPSQPQPGPTAANPRAELLFAPPAATLRSLSIEPESSSSCPLPSNRRPQRPPSEAAGAPAEDLPDLVAIVPPDGPRPGRPARSHKPSPARSRRSPRPPRPSDSDRHPRTTRARRAEPSRIARPRHPATVGNGGAAQTDARNDRPDRDAPRRRRDDSRRADPVLTDAQFRESRRHFRRLKNPRLPNPGCARTRNADRFRHLGRRPRP